VCFVAKDEKINKDRKREKRKRKDLQMMREGDENMHSFDLILSCHIHSPFFELKNSY
jgi:hypothetical protein